MKRQFLVFSAALVLLFALQACSAPNDFVRPDSAIAGRVYPVTGTQAFKIAETILRWEGADHITVNRSKGCVIGTVGNVAAICAWIDQVDSDNTMVTAASRHRNFEEATAFTGTAFYWRFSEAVSIVNSGKPLPAIPPH